MQIALKELRRLSNLELAICAGEIVDLSGDDATQMRSLRNSPVQVNMAADPNVCYENLYRIALGVRGRQDTFYRLVKKI
ncbi:MAG: hypothetical protein PHF67_00515, partial [Candidatus Nanoarchaeia archaeon]|nr:hypothetical protein [Candidatus Nanoarchaeia archaeon]